MKSKPSWICSVVSSLVIIAFPHHLLPTLLAADPPPEVLREQAKRCRHILKTSIVDFYLPACVDEANGGYLESLRDGKFAATGEKFLTMQGRQLWFFSTLAREGLEKEAALVAAKTGFAFLENKMHDRRHGGYFSKVTDSGDPKDTRKHVYLNAFALYGLVAYHRATRDDSAVKAAQDLFRVLEDKAHDKEHGGYLEFFDETWRPITDPKEAGYVGAIGTKTYNTHLHVLEALAELYVVWPDPLVAKRLEDLILINSNTVRHPEFNCNIDGWRPGKREYYDTFSQTLDFVEKHQVAKEGSWWATRAADGSPMSDQRSSPWQGAYHNGRSMILCAKMLEELANNSAKDK